MKRYLLVLVSFLLVSVLTVSVLAAGEHTIEIAISDTSYTDRTGVPALVPYDVDQLVGFGYLDPSGLDSRVFEGDQERGYMVADDKIGIFIPSLSSNQTRLYDFVTQYSPPSTSYGLITGSGGNVTVADNAGLELGTAFAILVVGYVDTSSGSNKNIVRKDGAVLLSITSAQEITFAITGGPSLVATGVESGYMSILIWSNGIEIWLEIDDVAEDDDIVSLVPDTSNSWVLFENDVVPYMSYFGMWDYS